MFIDLNEIDSGSNLTFGLCIIGAGTAVISLAHRFREKNISVALLESGGLEFDPAIQDLNAD
jgi:flavin-dependent dehydrogenase